MADKNFIVKNGLEVGGQEVVSSSGVVTSAALGGQTLASTDSPTFNNLTLTNDIEVGGDLNLTGDLNITGDVNSLSVTDLDVTDQTITLGAGQVESASGGSGIVVDGSGASILWDETNDEWDFNKSVNITTTSGNGITIDATQNTSIRLDSDNNTTGPFMIRVNSDEFHIKNQALSGFGEGGSFLKYTDGGSLQFLGDGLVVTSSDFVSIGHTDPDNKLHIQGAGVTGGIFVEDSNNSSVAPVIKVQGNRSDTNESQSFTGGLALSALQTNALANDGKHIGTIYFGTNHTDGTAANIAYSASIAARLSGAANSATDMPTDLVFYTGSTGSALGTSNQTYGDEALRIDSSGNVGIGTDDVTDKLTINASAGDGITFDGISASAATEQDVSDIKFINRRSSGTTVKANIKHITNGTANGSALTFGTTTGPGVTERMRIDASGNVGIGTTSPAFKLDIEGADNSQLRLLGTDTNPTTLVIDYNNTGSTDRIRIKNDAGDMKLTTSNGQDRITILKAGNVGIGTDSPDTKLHLSGADNEAVVRLENSSTGLTEGDVIGSLEFYKSDSSGAGVGVSGSLKAVSGNASGAETDLIFGTSSTARGNNAETMRLTGEGNVGIGTNDPSRSLSISGTGSEYINIVGGTSSGVGLLLGDSDAEIRGAVIYDNANDTLGFRAGGNVTRALVGSNRFEIDPTNDRYKFTYDGSSYNEGLRMAPHSNGYSVLVLGAGTGDTGTVEGQWTLARHPDANDNKLTLRYFDTADAWEILKTGEVGFGGSPTGGVVGTGLKLETINDTNSAYTSTGSTSRLPAGLQISTRNSHNANDSLSGIAMQSSGGGGGTMGGYVGVLPSSTYSTPKMVFGLTSGTSAWREDIRILGVDGTKRHVGIGNINPSEELHVSTATGGVTRIRIDSTSSARNNYIGCTNYDELVLAADEDNEGLNSEIKFRVDGTERLKINSDGNLGLGDINPGNWGNIWQVIEGGLASTYSGFVAFQNNANDMKLGTNVYHDGGNFRYRHDGNGIFVELNRENFVINFVPTGTADDVISFDEAFKINKTTGIDFVVKRIHLTQTADQSITEGGTIYANFGSQSHIDTDTFTHSTSTNSDNITVDRAGLYQIIGNFVFINAAASARNTVRVSVRVNGVTQNTTASFDYDRGSSYGEFSNNKINTIIDLNANDVIDFEVFGQNIDGTCSLDASFTEVIMTRIGKSG